MTSSIPKNSKQYVGFINNEPVSIAVMTPFPHPTNKNIVKSSRIVTLPHWQGFGIGMRMSDWVCENLYKDKCIHATTSLPIRQKYLEKSKNWLLKSQGSRNSDGGENTLLAKNMRNNVYMETYKFINSAIDESDLEIKYRSLDGFDIPKKNNDHKMDIILSRIKENLLLNNAATSNEDAYDLENLFS